MSSWTSVTQVACLDTHLLLANPACDRCRSTHAGKFESVSIRKFPHLCCNTNAIGSATSVNKPKLTALLAPSKRSAFVKYDAKTRRPSTVNKRWSAGYRGAFVHCENSRIRFQKCQFVRFQSNKNFLEPVTQFVRFPSQKNFVKPVYLVHRENSWIGFQKCQFVRSKNNFLKPVTQFVRFPSQKNFVNPVYLVHRELMDITTPAVVVQMPVQDAV